MKRNLKRLALIALMLSAGNSAHGDGSGLSVGDLPGYGEKAYFHEDATYATGASVASNFVGDNYVGDIALPLDDAVQSASHTLTQPLKEKSPLTRKPLAPKSRGKHSENCDTDGCEPTCESSELAETAAIDLMGRMKKRLEQGDYWMSSEALLWFTPNRSMPALITTSDPQTLPILPEGGVDNVQTVFGDDIKGEASGGIRLDFGTQLAENFAIGGRFWWLGNNDDSHFASDDGSTMSIGRPIYNTFTQDNDALLVAIDPVDVTDANFTGSVVGRSQLKLWAAEGYGLINLAKVKNGSIDLIGGYSHFSISDMLSMQSETIDESTARIRRYNDQFDIDNEFNGGQIGFNLAMSHGRWSASSLTKIHLGNMNQQVSIVGSSFDQTPPATPNVTSGGLLAMGNQGEYERDTFSFVPEVNFKLGYAIRDNVDFTLGYSFIYFDNVALVGDIIDNNVDPLFLNTGTFGARPAFDFDDSGMWVQGIDFGLTIQI